MLTEGDTSHQMESGKQDIGQSKDERPITGGHESSSAPIGGGDEISSSGMHIHISYASMGGDLLILAITSFFVFIQAAVSCEASNTCATTPTAEDKTLISYAIAVGLVSGILCILSLIAHKMCSLPDRARLILLVFLVLWWLVAAALLTFGGPSDFVTVSNGYFCTWASLLISGYALHNETSSFKGAIDNVKSQVSGSPEEIRYLYLFMLSSLVVIFSAISPCIALCQGTPGYAIAVGGISFFIGIILRFAKHRIGGKVGLISVVLVLLWGITAAILTFKGPFTFVGNGYFASYGAFAAAALYMNRNL